MYIITDHDGVIICLSDTLGYQENGNPLVNDGTLAIASAIVGGISGDVAVPEGVAPRTHCYTGGEFTENPNYTAPPPDIEERIAAVEADTETLAQAVNILLGSDSNA